MNKILERRLESFKSLYSKGDPYTIDDVYAKAGQLLENDPETLEGVLEWHINSKMDLVGRLEFLQERAFDQAFYILDQETSREENWEHG